MFIRIYTEYSGVVKKLNVITGGINMASPQQVASFLYTALEFKEVTDRQGNSIRGKANKSSQPGSRLLTNLQLKSWSRKRPCKSVRTKGREVRKEDYCIHGAVYMRVGMTSKLYLIRLRSTKGLRGRACSMALESVYIPDTQTYFI